ncbi:hypothetical protein AB0F17_64845 [Nonomuraea sp. NPDC026600]|uniref:hypothetical protein n=1 Tax=Nonomuraea sp. NPDC026600 TaxID=3155363 RepID=UPI0033F892C2
MTGPSAPSRRPAVAAPAGDSKPHPHHGPRAVTIGKEPQLNTDPNNRWRGEMLVTPENMDALSGQIRALIADLSEFIGPIRMDAEAMWRANPPEEYGRIEAAVRHHKLVSKFAKLQEHLEEARKLTFEVAAQYRKQRHDVPARKAEAAEIKREAALNRGPAAPRHLSGGQPYPRPRPASRPGDDDGGSFMDRVQSA